VNPLRSLYCADDAAITNDAAGEQAVPDICADIDEPIVRLQRSCQSSAGVRFPCAEE